MAKPYGRLGTLDTYTLRGLPESGMGYYLLRGRLDHESSDRDIIVAGDRIVLADPHSQFLSLSDLWKREPFPEEARQLFLADLRIALSVTLPTGYTATPGAVPLLGSLTLTAPTKFYRFLMTSSDFRFSHPSLSQDTYLTTDLDRQLVNTGFGVVGRYALPVPVPASYIFEYELPAGAILSVGTVQPNFGQAGGGVEVKTTSALNVVQKALANLADC